MLVLIFFIILFLSLQFLDLISTRIGLKNGAIELNPLGKNHFKKTLIVKTCLAILLIYFSFFNVFAYYSIMIANIFMAIVVINNFIQILRVKREKDND